MSSNLNSLPVVDQAGRPLAEMAAWDPMDEHNDAAWEYSELDRRGMALLGQVGVATLALALVTGVVTRLS
jgi:hypothetical protein